MSLEGQHHHKHDVDVRATVAALVVLWLRSLCVAVSAIPKDLSSELKRHNVYLSRQEGMIPRSR